MGRLSVEESIKRLKAMQEDRDKGMTSVEIAEKYGVSDAYVRKKTKRPETEPNIPRKPPDTKEWIAVEKQLQELVRINNKVRRQNAIARKPRDIASAGRTFRYWPEERFVDRKWPKQI